ncbi:MAG: DUF1810 domain-containing protein [Pseudomonadota bacterium]
MSGDPFNLARFVKPQDGVWPQVRAELAAGRKQSHWIWFVFPQIAGLGSSVRSVHFAISSRDEARAYLDHDILGPRLIEATRLMLAVEDRTAFDILGAPDDRKFHSSMTLFDTVSPNDIFAAALEKYFNGEGDAATLAKLSA